MIDFRSDTVTKPTQAMRDAMATAEVGDDVYREDPTVVRLEELGAKMLGKEAGLFVCSGTMGNQVAIMTHTQRGDELITEAESHIFYYEVGDIAMLSGVQARQVPGKRGVMDPDDVKHAIRDSSNIHFPRTSLIAIENTHNRGGGQGMAHRVRARDIGNGARAWHCRAYGWSADFQCIDRLWHRTGRVGILRRFRHVLSFQRLVCSCRIVARWVKRLY